MKREIAGIPLEQPKFPGRKLIGIRGPVVPHSPTSMGAFNKERLKNLMAEFGRLGLIIYLILFATVLVGFALAIQMGFQTESTAGKAGIWGAAWLATKVTQPLRILATLALTPLVAQVLKRWKKPVPPAGGPETPHS